MPDTITAPSVVHQTHVTGGQFEATFTLAAPNWLWRNGQFKASLTPKLRDLCASYGRKLAAAGRSGFTFQPLRGSFKLIDPGPRADGALVAGTTSPDAILWFVEHDDRPHWPPLAPLERWVKRLRQNPRPPFKHKITAVQVQRSIASKGTVGKHVMSVAMDTLADAFEQEAITTILAVLGD